MERQLKPVRLQRVSAAAARCADAIVIVLSLWLAYQLRGLDNAELYLPAGLVALPLYLLFGGGAPVRERTAAIRELFQEIRVALTAWAWTLAGLLVIAWTAKVTADYSRLAVGFWAIFGALGLVGWRLTLQFATRHGRTSPTGAPAVIAGAGERALGFGRFLQSGAAFGATLAGCFAESERTAEEVESDGFSLPVLGNLEELVERAGKGEFSTVFVAMRPEAGDACRRLVAALCDTPVSVYIVPNTHAEELAHARWVDCGGLPLVSIFETPYSGANSWVKRTEDVVLALLMLLVSAAPMLIIAAAIRLTSPGPALFRQRRHGIDGREIRVLKFRTMTVIEDGADVRQAVREDDRHTPIGKFLRRTSLDELPQIYNVLRGDMSVVGPRPHAVSVNLQYRELIPGYMLRHRVRPGITGWAQIHGLRGSDSPENMEKRVRYDLWYLARWSLWLDLWIVARSVPALVGHRNAF